MRQLRCPACGEAFDCGADQPLAEGCWCTRVTLGPATLDTLAATFDGCLCPACLASSAPSSAGTGPGPADQARP